jgi:serine/threonine-protein kinase
MKYIGKYRISGFLGKGGMSRVYQVRIPVIEKTVALKLLFPHPFLVDLIGMKQIESLFLSEAVVMAGLRHPHILEIWDFDRDQTGKPFYIMAYYCNNLGMMMGETYEVEQPSRIIPTDKAIPYIRQTLSGLACLHHAGIIHGDIKPFNLLITDQDTIKIGDFGLSRMRGETFEMPENLKVGSPFYAAPEQETHPDEIDFNADLYAVGITLYRMVTGVLPEAPVTPPSRLSPDMDAVWDRFILKSIARNPNDRFQTATDMMAGLQEAENAWIQRKEAACQLVALRPSPVCPPARKTLRKVGIRTAPKNARDRFDLDMLWRPKCHIANDFVMTQENLIQDRETGLIWQQSGSPYPLTWYDAKTLIGQLNAACHGGRNDWRLPTVDELTTLLTESPHAQDLCIQPVFDTTQKWLWSSDRRSYTAAWYVSLDLGFVSWQDFSGFLYVKAVSN